MSAERVIEKTNRVAVVEDHVLVRQSLVKAIASLSSCRVVGEAGDHDEAVELIRRTEPDLVLVDVEIPGGDGLGVAELAKGGGARVIFLTMHDDDFTVRRAVAIGADGFVPKTASVEELLSAVESVAAGGTYLSSGVARRIMDLAAGGDPLRLTDRELEIVTLLTTGLDHEEIATRLFVSVKTVKNQLTSIYAKLGVRSAAQAVAAAYRRGLVNTGAVGGRSDPS